jgi:hypothetical protein
MSVTLYATANFSSHCRPSLGRFAIAGLAAFEQSVSFSSLMGNRQFGSAYPESNEQAISRIGAIAQGALESIGHLIAEPNSQGFSAISGGIYPTTPMDGVLSTFKAALKGWLNRDHSIDLTVINLTTSGWCRRTPIPI